MLRILVDGDYDKFFLEDVDIFCPSGNASVTFLSKWDVRIFVLTLLRQSCVEELAKDVSLISLLRCKDFLV